MENTNYKKIIFVIVVRLFSVEIFSRKFVDENLTEEKWLVPPFVIPEEAPPAPNPDPAFISPITPNASLFPAEKISVQLSVVS